MINVFQKFKHAELIHSHYQGTLDLKVDFPYEAGKDSLLRGQGDVGGHEMKVGILKICSSKSVEGGANVEERINGEGECGRAEVVGELVNVLGVREVVAESVGIEGNSHGVNRSKNCSQRDRRKTIRCRRGGTPPSFRSSR